MTRTLWTIPLALLTTVAFATNNIYKTVDSNGHVTYTDIQPNDNSQPISVKPLESFQLPPLPTQANPTTVATATAAAPAATSAGSGAYTEFSIISPHFEETFQNQPTIPVSLSLEPELKEGHKILLLVNGQPYGAPAPNLKWDLPLLERNTYQLAAQVLDENNQVLKQAGPVTFFVKRHSIQNP